MKKLQNSMEKTEIIGVYGTGGCGRGIMPLLIQRHKKTFFIDDNSKKKIINNFEVINYKSFKKIKSKKKSIIIAIADTKIREKLFKKIKKDKIKLFSFFDKNSLSFGNNIIGEGCLVSPYSTIASNVKIGKCFHSNLYSFVEHDSKIGNFVTFATGVKCNGNVIIGNHVFIGSGAIIKNGTKKKPIIIESNVKIGAGAVVTKNLKKNYVYVGNPAYKLKKNKI